MPNHITNRIIGHPGLINQILTKEKEGNESIYAVDFSRIIPRPKEIISNDINSRIDLAAKVSLGLIDFSLLNRQEKKDSTEAFSTNQLKNFIEIMETKNAYSYLFKGEGVKDFTDEDFEIYITYLRTYRKHGVMHWHNWNKKHWGTKWNAYDTIYEPEKDPNVITFQTAWCAPTPVMNKLAQIVRSRKTLSLFTHEWADETIGSNVGYTKYEEGQAVETKELSHTNEGYELAFKLIPGISQYFELTDEGYQYKG